MRLILVILILSSGTVHSRTYYEKRRFDRSIHDDSGTLIANSHLPNKQWTFIDDETYFKAYKDKEVNDCYLEKLEDIEELPENRLQQRKRVLYASTEALTKLEAWRIAGGRIVDFCRGRQIILVQSTMPVLVQTVDPFSNVIPLDENDIVARRVADVVLTPLISRAKRQIVLEEREKLNENFRQTRTRRQTQPPRGRFRGQTQSQYLNIGTNDQTEGKAEAEATQQSSRAVVSGSRGMGQAQSMSSSGSGCEDCPKYPSKSPDRYVQHPGAGAGTISGTGEIRPGTGGAYPNIFPTIDQTGGRIVHPGTIIPGRTYTNGQSSGGTVYPGSIPPGSTGVLQGSATINKDMTYPYVFISGTTMTRGGVVYPVSVSGTPTGGIVYPGRAPGTSTIGGGRVYPGQVPSPLTTGGGAVYPGSVPGTTTTGGGTVYPGGVSGTTTTGGGGYPGTTTTGGGTVHPGTTTTGDGAVYPGRVPGIQQPGGGAVYPGSVPGIQQPGGGAVYPGTTTTGGGTVYPGTTTTGGGTVHPGTTTTGGGAVYPGSVPGIQQPGGGVAYPGATATGSGTVYPGTTTTGGGAVYPGSVPGIQQPGGGAVYPGSVPGIQQPGGGAVYPGSVPAIQQPGGGAGYPGGVSGTTTAGGGGYPGTTTTGGGTVHPGTTTTGGGAVYPGSVPGIQQPGGGAVYPGATATGSGTVHPGMTTNGGGAVYPGSVPGIQQPGGGAVYPGSVPGIQTPGGGAVYPGGVPGTTTTGGRVVYPGNVPGTTTTGGGTVFPGSVPGIQTPGGGVIYPGSTTTGGGTVYPGGVPGTTTVGGGGYPGSGPGIQTPGGGVIYPGSVPGTTTTGGGTVYPGSVPGTTTTGGGRIITDSKATADTKIYPGQIPGGLYPGMVVTGPSSGGSPGTIAYPGGVTRPGDVIQGISSYPGSIATGTPGQLVTGGRINYPGGIPTGVGGTGLYPSGTFPGTNVPNIAVPPDAGIVSYPGVTQPKVDQVLYPPSAQSQLPYPNVVQKYPDGSVIQYPEVGKYPGSPGTVPSGYPSQQGHYPGTVAWPTGQGQSIPGMTGGISGQGTGQYPGAGQTNGQQYPGLQYPTGTGPAANIREPSQYYQQPVSVATTGDDNSDSQASSSVKQTDAGTQASASAQGTHGQGTAQSQVSGTYTGSGSFSAQAGSSDNNKSAQTEVSGGKGGAMSNSQGTGGYGKSQAQVQLDSESGATSTGAQSSGWNHGTNSQVQASSKGGMADAQANGEGSTSSQAQIGFQPYLKTNEKLERHSEPFRGGGTASAQSGTNRGQSQSQLEGSFQYGITYSGAAQAGSGSGAVASRKPFNFSRTDTEIFHSFKPYNTPQTGKDNRSDVTNVSVDEYNQDKSTQGLHTSSSSRKTIITNVPTENSPNVGISQNQSAEKSQVDDTMYEYDEEYDGEDYDSTQMQTSMNSKQSKATIVESNTNDHQSQTIQFTTGNRYDVRVKQDSNTPQTGDMLQPGQSLPGYTIPPGFRGRVTSVAGDVTIAHGDGKSQSQTVSLTPVEPNITRENKSPVSEIRSLKTNHERLVEDRASFKDKHKKYNNPRVQSYPTSMEYSKPTTDLPIKQSYYTVTNSFAGKMDGSRNSPRKYEHRYYTKSSTCGYFTFSCNVVYGSNGRTKICKPKMPTHPDGTPMKC